MKIILATVTNMLAAFGELLAKPMSTALRFHITIFAFLFVVFTLAGAYEFLVLLYKLVVR